MLVLVVRIRLFKEHCMWCTAIWPRAPNSQSCPCSTAPRAGFYYLSFPWLRVSLTPAGHAQQWRRPPWVTQQGTVSPLSVDKLTNKHVLKGNDVLSLQDKAQSYSRLQVNSGSISEIFSTDISPVFTETCLGLCSWILANQQFTQCRDSFLCFLYTVWLLSYLALAGTLSICFTWLLSPTFEYFWVLIQKIKNSDQRPRFF